MSTEYLYRTGSLKLPEFTWDFTDHRTFTVASDIAAATVTAGNFEIVTESAIDVSGEDAWPAAGHLCINGRVFTYTSISGDTFVDCNGSLGDVDETDIIAGDIGYQAVPATIINQLINSEKPGTVYQASSQSGLNVTIAPFYVIDGGEELSYAGGTLALDNGATNHVYAYNNAGTITIGKNSTSFSAAASGVGSTIIQLAVIVTSGGAITSGSSYDLRNAFVLTPTGGGGAGITGSGSDDCVPRFNGSSAIEATDWKVDNVDDELYCQPTGAGGDSTHLMPGYLWLQRDSQSAVALQITDPSDDKDYFEILGDGSHLFGDTINFPDATLKRYASGTLGIGGEALAPGALRLYEDSDNGSNYVEFKAPASLGGNTSIDPTTIILSDTTATRKHTFKAIEFMYPSTNPATPNGAAVIGTDEICVEQISFDASTEQYIHFTWHAPGNWNGSTVTAKFLWMPRDTSAGDVIWGLQGRSFADGDDVNNSLGTAQEVTDAAQASTTKLHKTSATAAITITGAGAGEMVAFRAYRKAADAGDTYAETAQLIGIEITYGINAYSE